MKRWKELSEEDLKLKDMTVDAAQETHLKWEKQLKKKKNLSLLGTICKMEDYYSFL